MFIFMDLDGTLIDFNVAKITEKTAYALQEARKEGHKVFLNTGRPVFRLEQIDLTLFDGYICYSGGYVYTDKKVLYQNFLDSVLLEKIICACGRLEIDMSFMGERKSYYSGRAYEYFLKIPEGREKGKAATGLSTDFCGYKTDQIYKVGLYCKNVDAAESLKKELGNLCTIVYSSATPDNKIQRFELTRNGINKWTGIEKILSYYQASQEDTVGIGDNWNDLEMIQNCSTGIVMGNAPDQLKELADYVTESSENEGIYHAMQWLNIS